MIDQKTEPETTEQRRKRHDVHLLHLLENFSRGIDELDIRYSTENERRGRNSLRFSATVPDNIDGPYKDGKNHLQVGLSRVTTTLPFNCGNPVLHFFCFYSHRRDLDKPESVLSHNDYLYNSALYIYKLPLLFSRKPVQCLRAYNKTSLQKIVKGINDLSRSPTSPLYQFPKRGEPKHNPRLDDALQEAVFKAVVHLEKQEDCRNIVGVALK